MIVSDALGTIFSSEFCAIIANTDSSNGTCQTNLCKPIDPEGQRITEYAYTADGALERLILINEETGDQVTRWIYGTTTDDSEIARTDLLRAKIYPMSDDEAEPLGDGMDGVYQRIEYSYNRQGQVLTMTDANETKHAYAYDNLGRQAHDEIEAFGENIDDAVKRIGTSYDTRGMVSKVTSYDYLAGGSGSIVNEVAYEYDDFGQLSKDSQAHSGAVTGTTPAVSYGYENASSGNTARRKSMTYPNGRVLDLEYGTPDGENDVLSRIEGLKINGETESAATYTYVGMARYVRIAYPEPGVELTYIKESSDPVGDAGDPYTGYDRFGRTVEMRWQPSAGGDPLDHFQWGFDRSSNRTWRKNLVAPANQDEHYGYDELNQVTGYGRGNLNINRTGIGGIAANNQTFSYDPTGNWERFTNSDDGVESLDQTRVHNQDNQLTQIDGSNTGILYDKAGNATQMPPDKSGDWDKYYQLTWDAWNRLVKVTDKNDFTVATYAYDGRTRRTTKTADGVTVHFYYNDLWRPVEEREDASTAAERQMVWGAREGHRDEMVLRDRDTNGNGTLDERLFCQMDYYNPTAVISDAGSVVERYSFSAFGLRSIMDENWGVRASSSYAFDFGFHGQFVDEETGYYNYGFRYYSPSVGRWINRDPIEELGGSNLYAYSANSALNIADSLGLINNDKCHGSLNDAITAACLDFGPISATTFIEYAGVITDCSQVEEKECFKYTFVTSELINTVNSEAINASADQCPNCSVVAVWHTHPRFSRNHPDIIPLIGAVSDEIIKNFINNENRRQDIFSGADVNYSEVGSIKNEEGEQIYGPPIRLGLCGTNGTVRTFHPDENETYQENGERVSSGTKIDTWL